MNDIKLNTNSGKQSKLNSGKISLNQFIKQNQGEHNGNVSYERRFDLIVSLAS